MQDAAGNTTSIGQMDLIYNQRNRLIRAEDNGVVVGEYEYNAMGQRVTKTIDGATTVFIYDFDGNIIAESDIDGTLQKEYIYILGNRFAMIDSATYYLYFYHNDHLGTPILMTDVYGDLVWEGNYAPFGDVEISEASSIENNFRFAGQYYDHETDLHYNYHRYYDPATGRYLTPDPIGLAGGINLYAYTENNPINLIDPLGLDTTTNRLNFTFIFGDITIGRATDDKGNSGLVFSAALGFSASVGVTYGKTTTNALLLIASRDGVPLPE